MKIDVIFRKFLHQLISLLLTSCTSTFYRNFTEVITLTCLIILSRVYGRNQFWHEKVTCLPWLIISGSGLDDWIYWHFFTITTNQWLSKTRSIPYWTTGVFLFHCDEWRTKSPLRLNHWTYLRMPNVWTFVNWTELNFLFVTSRRTDYKSPSRTFRLLLRPFVAAETCLPSRCPALGYSVSIRCRGNLC
jgi:hypothetical protein